MAKIVVIGGGMIGLCSAMMLATDGHDVTVLEADPEEVPGDPEQAWSGWDRKGVAQFHQPHNLMPRFRQVAEQNLPGLTDRLLAHGCTWLEPLATVPPGLDDTSARADDERFSFPTGRRPVAESAVAAHVEGSGAIDVRRGVKVRGFTTGPSAAAGIPHVTGVVLEDGAEVGADLVVDAMGRRTRTAEWLSEVGGPPVHQESEDCGFAYYTRYFTGPERPAIMGPLLSPLGCFSLLTMPGDNDTWSVTAFVATGDPPLKTLRDKDAFTRLVRACPLQAHWLDGEPITDVVTMAGILDRYRRFVVDGQPVVTGLAPVGDAWASTNPSAGRGLSVGIVHAETLRQAVAAGLDDPVDFALRYDAATQERVAPFYWNQIRADRIRVAEMNALRDGAPPPPPDPMFAAFAVAAGRNADVFRGMLEIGLCLSFPEEVLTRPAVQRAVEQAAGERPTPLPGPDREQVLALLAG